MVMLIRKEKWSNERSLNISASDRHQSMHRLAEIRSTALLVCTCSLVVNSAMLLLRRPPSSGCSGYLFVLGQDVWTRADWCDTLR